MLQKTTSRIHITTMRIMYLVLVQPCTVHAISHAPITPYKAVIIHPIVDMSEKFPPSINPPASPEMGYCARDHQGLYNEIITVQEEHGEYAKVRYDDVRYASTGDNSFWIFKGSIRPLAHIKRAHIKAHIPNMKYGARPTIVLTYPWHTFSLGTRFNHVPERDSCDSYGVTWIDHTRKKIRYGTVPRSNAKLETKHSPAVQRKIFIHSIRNLLNRVSREGNDVVIPYVWGGSSFLQPYKKDTFYLENAVWKRTEHTTPYAGYDCSELIMRMAKMAGMDFPWKRSTVMQEVLKKLTPTDTLEEGDIIWTEGHVMIVGNLTTNEVYESRGYGGGYGEVHRIPLHELFDGVYTFDQLRDRHHRKETVTYKKKDGGLYKEAYPVQLLKLID